jgi:hypothetical protein
MARKKPRAIDSGHTLTWIFAGLLALSVAAGFIAQIGHSVTP